MQPALTAEEWTLRLSGGYRGADENTVGIPFIDDGDVCVTYDSGFAAQPVPEEERPALAALALHGQPFGFTREDVKVLRQVARGDWGMEAPDPVTMSIADRIEALLPPEGL